MRDIVEEGFPYEFTTSSVISKKVVSTDFIDILFPFISLTICNY